MVWKSMLMRLESLCAIMVSSSEIPPYRRQHSEDDSHYTPPRNQGLEEADDTQEHGFHRYPEEHDHSFSPGRPSKPNGTPCRD